MNKDILLYIAGKLDLPDLLNFCQIDKRINEIWSMKLITEFSSKKDKNPKETYQRLYWERLKEQLEYHGTVEKLLYAVGIYLEYYNLTKIPKEIGNLTNLQELDLSNNKLTEIPKEIGNLTNLQILNLGHNRLKKIPKEIGNLINLQKLWLEDNQLTEISKEIGNLTNLQYFFLHKNQLKDIPEEICNLTNLKLFYIDPELKLPKGINKKIIRSHK